MKKIKLHITSTFVHTIDLKNVNRKDTQVLDGLRVIPLGRIDIGAGHKEIETARENGAQIVYGLLSIEQNIEKVLAEYLFGLTLGSPKPKKDFFVNEILQSNRFDFSFKKELLNKIVNNHELLVGQDKDILQNNLTKIMVWRNAFAHGRLVVDNSQVCHLEYYSGGKKSLVLNDDFWSEVEACFQQIEESFKKFKFVADGKEMNPNAVY